MSNEDSKENLLSLHLHHFARKNRPLSPFISKLRFLLNCTKHQDAIHWSSDGRSIVITNVEVFKQSVLDNEAEMFKTKNFTSFVRQLNLYGFRKVPSNGKSDPATNMKFEHANFRRERPDLMQYIQRTCVVGGKRKGELLTTFSPETRPLAIKKATPILYIKHDNKENIFQHQIQSGLNAGSIVGKPLGLSILKAVSTNIPGSSNVSLINNQHFAINVKPNIRTVFAPSKNVLSTDTKIISFSQIIEQNVKSSPPVPRTSSPQQTHQPMVADPTTKNLNISDNPPNTTDNDSTTEPILYSVTDLPNTSSEHDYALPTTPDKFPIVPDEKPAIHPTNTSSPKSPPMITDQDIYQFLNENFSAEKEVVQSLLSLPESQPDQIFDDLKTLAEVSSNSLLGVDNVIKLQSGSATPRETVVSANHI